MAWFNCVSNSTLHWDLVLALNSNVSISLMTHTHIYIKHCAVIFVTKTTVLLTPKRVVWMSNVIGLKLNQKYFCTGYQLSCSVLLRSCTWCIFKFREESIQNHENIRLGLVENIQRRWWSDLICWNCWYHASKLANSENLRTLAKRH